MWPIMWFKMPYAIWGISGANVLPNVVHDVVQNVLCNVMRKMVQNILRNVEEGVLTVSFVI